MKLPKILFILICLFAVSQISFGQESLQAILIDDFSQLSCDELLSRIDSYVQELRNEPNSKGYIIVYGKKNKHLQNLRYEQLIKDAVKGRKFDRFEINRVIFARGRDGENLRVQLWKIPVGAEEPSYTKETWSYNLAEEKKSYIFNATSWDDGICPSISDSELYSKFLLSNRDFRGYLVIYETSVKKFHQRENELLREIVETYKVPRNQLKFFYVKNKRQYPNTEFWLVPKTKK